MFPSQETDSAGHTVVIFDFSGTLSLEAVLFAQLEPLIDALKQSGLWQLGLNNPKMLWREVISPTWNIGSTTARSYKEIMAEKLIEVLAAGEDEIQQTPIIEGVDRFIDSYFEAARVAPEWKPVLARLLNQPGIQIVVATDHYLEVTDHIRRELELWGLEAVPALEVNDQTPAGRQVIIANSSELGARKANRVYWDRLQALLPVEKPSMVILVDDFGANEPLARSDNLDSRVEARMEDTGAHISAVFQTRLELFPFFRKHIALDDAVFAELVQQASRFIDAHVLGGRSP